MKRGYSGVGLNQPKTNYNVGSVIRIADNFDIDFVAISGKRYSRAATDTMKTHRHVPVFHNVDSLRSIVPFDCVPVAIDLIEGAIPLQEYNHPERAFYIFGAEDQTLGRSVLSWCKDTVYVPTNRCMNLAVAVGVVFYDRMNKLPVKFSHTSKRKFNGR